MYKIAAMYSNANVWMQTFDCCCVDQERARSGGAQALVCNDWQPSAWDLRVDTICNTIANNRPTLTRKGFGRLTDSPSVNGAWHHILWSSGTGFTHLCVLCNLDTS